MKQRIQNTSLFPAFQIRKRMVVFTLLVILCNTLFSLDKSGKIQLIIITNTTSFNRVSEIITLQRNALGKMNRNLFPAVKKNGKIFITQTIDTNNDGSWDELLIEVSLIAHSKDTLQVVWVKAPPVFKKLTNVQLSVRSDSDTPSAEINNASRSRGFTQNIAQPFYQMEGPGIENDKVAFRAFFDYRNSEDIYGKIVETPVLDRVGVGAGWHSLQPWGMDIFHTGNSLGAGGLAVVENKQIFRLGDADSSTFQVLYEGPLQAALKLSFKNWDVGMGRKDGSETISITKGNFFYRKDIALDLSEGQQLLAGIANFGADYVGYKKHNDSFSSVYTYGGQAEGTNTRLGVAIMFPSDDYVENKTSDTASVIPNTSYIVLKSTKNKKKTIYFFACWEKTDGRFKTRRGFEDYLQYTAALLANPVQIKIIDNKKIKQ